MHITKTRPMAKDTHAHDRLAAARTRLDAAEAALAPHRAELSDLTAQLVDLRAKVAEAEEAVTTMDDARGVTELQMQLSTIERLTKIKNAALSAPAGALHPLVLERDAAMRGLTHHSGDLTRQNKRLEHVIDDLATALAALYNLTGDKEYLTFTLEVKV
jgi:chromosome segregation ATPase